MRRIVLGKTRISGLAIACAVAVLVFGGVAPSHAATIISFGDAGHSSTDGTGGWYDNTGIGLNLAEHYQYPPDCGTTSTWNFSGLANGTYYVSTNWVSEPNRTTSAHFSFSDGMSDAIVDQQATGRDFYELVGGKPIGWKNLGTVTISDGDFQVDLADDDDSGAGTLFLMADSIRLDTSPGVNSLPGLGQGIVVEDQDADQSFAGTWYQVAYGYNADYAGFNQDHWYDSEGGNNGALTSTWVINGLTPGVPTNVSTRWVEFSNRPTDAPYTISGISGGDQTVMVDQQVAPTADAYELDSYGVTGALLFYPHCIVLPLTWSAMQL